MNDLECLGVLLRKRFEVVAKENVALLNVAEEESELRLVARVRERVLEDLVHGRAVRQSVRLLMVKASKLGNTLHATATCHHSDVLELVH